MHSALLALVDQCPDLKSHSQLLIHQMSPAVKLVMMAVVGLTAAIVAQLQLEILNLKMHENIRMRWNMCFLIDFLFVKAFNGIYQYHVCVEQL